jgi:hypothetical protein
VSSALPAFERAEASSRAETGKFTLDLEHLGTWRTWDLEEDKCKQVRTRAEGF